MLPLYATLLSYPKQYVTALGNRFRQPLMEMVCYRFMQPY